MAQLATRELTIGDAARRSKVTVRTVKNWILNGLNGSGNERIKLKASRLGRKWMIHPTDLADFRRRLTDAAMSRAS